MGPRGPKGDPVSTLIKLSRTHETNRIRYVVLGHSGTGCAMPDGAGWIAVAVLRLETVRCKF